MAALLAVGGATPAVAATPVQLGQTATTTASGSCGCTVLQFGDAGSPGYEAPYSGVLTRFSVYVGTEINSTDWVQPRTFRRVGASSATVISEGAQHSLDGATPGAVKTFFDRVPAAAGDVLGARFHVADTVDATPVSLTSASSSDVFASSVSDPAVGDTFSPSFTGGSSHRVNVAAWLEPDADHDG